MSQNNQENLAASDLNENTLIDFLSKEIGSCLDPISHGLNNRTENKLKARLYDFYMR